jgi:hypothetical protein
MNGAKIDSAEGMFNKIGIHFVLAFTRGKLFHQIKGNAGENYYGRPGGIRMRVCCFISIKVDQEYLRGY